LDFPETLLAAECTAWEALQAGQLTVDQAVAVQDGVTAYAKDAGLDRHTVEMALKRAVRHGQATG
jgi:DNA-binding phage protein